MVRPAFQMAVDDDLIRKNPFEFQLATVVVNDSVTREAITRKQQRAFLEFIKADKHFNRYYEGIYILFHTGLRISEFVGLTVSDIDLENGKINIDHQLQRKRNMELGKVFLAYMRKVQQDLQRRTTKDYTSCMQAYLLFQHGKIGNESKNIAENNGTFRYWCNTEYLYAFGF